MAAKRLTVGLFGPSFTLVDPAFAQGTQAGTVSIDRGSTWGRPGLVTDAIQATPAVTCVKGNKIKRLSVRFKIFLIPTLMVRTAALSVWSEWYVPTTYKDYDITGTVATYNCGTRIIIGYANRNIDRTTALNYLAGFTSEQTTDFGFTLPIDRNIFVPMYDRMHYSSLAAQRPKVIHISLRGKRGMKNIVLPYDLTTGAQINANPLTGNLILCIINGYTNWIDPRTAGNTVYDRVACANEVNMNIMCTYSDN